jgi:hypothetical protein
MFPAALSVANNLWRYAALCSRLLQLPAARRSATSRPTPQPRSSCSHTGGRALAGSAGLVAQQRWWKHVNLHAIVAAWRALLSTTCRQSMCPLCPPALPACPCRAGGAGITLTAGTHIILCEPTLNPSFERQAIGRSHRMGQDKPLTATRLRMKGGRAWAGCGWAEIKPAHPADDSDDLAPAPLQPPNPNPRPALVIHPSPQGRLRRRLPSLCSGRWRCRGRVWRGRWRGA